MRRRAFRAASAALPYSDCCAFLIGQVKSICLSCTGGRERVRDIRPFHVLSKHLRKAISGLTLAQVLFQLEFFRPFNSEKRRGFRLKTPCNHDILDRMFLSETSSHILTHGSSSAPLLTSANGILWQPPPHRVPRAPPAAPQVTKPALKDVIRHPLTTLLTVGRKFKPSPVRAVVSTLMSAGDVIPEPLRGNLDITAGKPPSGYGLSSVEEALFNPLGAVAVFPWLGADVTELCRARASEKSSAV